MMMMVMVVMICDIQSTFTFMFAFHLIFLAFLAEDLHQNHILLTLRLCALLFWAIPKEFNLFSVIPRTRRWKLQEDRFELKIGIFIFNGQRYQKMTVSEKECVSCPWQHTCRGCQPPGEDVVKGMEKSDLVAFQFRESEFLV